MTRVRKEEIFWKTVKCAPTRSREKPWKKSMGEACPHGDEIFLVDGPYVRNTFSSDMVQGDNHYHSPKFVPKGELWIDDSMPTSERPFVAFHECHESDLMSKGMDYESAHDRAKALEDKYRKIHRPGERRR